MKRIEEMINKWARNSWIQHLLFWSLSMYVLARLFCQTEELSAADWIYTFLFHLSLVPVVYLNVRWLIPVFLTRSKFVPYLLFSALVLLTGIGINLLTFDWLADILFPDYYFIGYYGFWDILEFAGVYFIVSGLLKLSKGWFENIRASSQIHRLEKEKLDAELNALKAQVNPHFLFNSLNNLYSLALDQDKRTPDLILQLAGMMRYVLYETNATRVPLEKEIEHLENYMELQELRVGEKVDIRFNIMGDPSGKEIAPLLFLPLVENGFKHGVKGETERSFIHLQLDISEDRLVFKVENNKGETDEGQIQTSKGVGLQNLKRRLMLLYPESHSLAITDGIEFYTVVLKIELS